VIKRVSPVIPLLVKESLPDFEYFLPGMIGIVIFIGLPDRKNVSTA